MKFKKYIDYIVLSIILLFHSILNIWYIIKDTKPPAWDQSVHLLLSSAYFRGFDIRTTSGFYPPGFHLSTAPLYALFGESYNAGCFINIIFLGILLFSIYGIGKILFNREVGLISAIFISFIPVFILLQRDFLLDFALVSIVSLTIYLLLKTDNFNNVKYSLLFGVSFGFALLIKWSAIFFLFIPLCWVLWQVIKEPKKCAYCSKVIKSTKNIVRSFHHFCSERHKKKFIEEKRFLLTKAHNILFSFLLCITTAGWWYFPNYKVFSKLKSGQQYWGSVEGDPVGLLGFWYYIEAVNKQVFLVFGLILLFGLVFLLLKADKDKKIFIGLSLLVPFLIFSLVRNKDIRYTLPLLIFLALSVGFMVASINSKKLKSALVLGIILFGVIQTSTITFGYPSFDVPNYIYPHSNSPKQEDWKINEVLGIIQSNADKPQSAVLILYNHAYMNWRTLQYYTFISNIPYHIEGYEFINARPDLILNFDFVLYVEEDINITTEQKNQIMRANRIFEECISEFEIVGSVVLPNEKELYIYKKRR